MIELVSPSGAKGKCLSLRSKAGILMVKHDKHSVYVTKERNAYCPLAKVQGSCAWGSFPVM